MIVTPAQRMMDLFGGHKNSYGTHGEPELDDNGLKWKIKSTAKSIRGKVTVKLWENHLKGTTPLGIVPINEDSKCMFGSIDVDDYEIDVLDVIKRVEAAKLPLVVCRSKSGGLHLFLFMKIAVDAGLMQKTLRDLAAMLGFGGSEIFPKQSKLTSEDRGEMGSWIVMPYFGGTFGGKLKLQHGIKKTGAEMMLSEFIKEVEKKLVEDLTTIKPKVSKKAKAPFSDGPPCLQHLAAMGVGQGAQNTTLFQMGVYFKKKAPENWKSELENANQDHMKPVYPSSELVTVMNSLDKKDYQYKCKDEPMCSHCDPMLCRTRKYGVGNSEAYPTITSLQKLMTEPPIWFVGVEGKTIAMETYQLQTYNHFQRLCMEFVDKCFAPVRHAVWCGIVAEAMANTEKIPAPPESGIAGMFFEHLEEFLTNRQRGTKVEDLLSGRSFEDEEHGVYYFRLKDLEAHLKREGLKDMTRPQITSRLRTIGGESKRLSIRINTGDQCVEYTNQGLQRIPYPRCAGG